MITTIYDTHPILKTAEFGFFTNYYLFWNNNPKTWKYLPVMV